MNLPISAGGRRYGFKPSPPDHRDFGLASFPRLSGPTATSVDLEADCGPVRDQGDEGSCTAHAGVGMREFLARKYQQQYPILSPSFLYWEERDMDGSLDQGDCGSFGRTAVRVLNKYGVCRLAEDVYIPGVMMPPTMDQLTEALSWKSGAYHSLGNVSDMRSCLASGYVFCLGFTVYKSFEDKWPDGVTMPIPAPDEEVLGGHEVLCIGYSDDKEVFKIRNSWGESFGQNGNFFMPYSVAANPQIVNEAWIQHLGKAWA
jgi:hypothetical protein